MQYFHIQRSWYVYSSELRFSRKIRVVTIDTWNTLCTLKREVGRASLYAIGSIHSRITKGSMNRGLSLPLQPNLKTPSWEKSLSRAEMSRSWKQNTCQAGEALRARVITQFKVWTLSWVVAGWIVWLVHFDSEANTIYAQCNYCSKR